MRFLLFGILAALTAYFAFGGNSSAIAGTDTPSATPSPSPTPSPTATPSVTPTTEATASPSPTPSPTAVAHQIRLTFRKDGEMVSIEGDHLRAEVFEGDMQCGGSGLFLDAFGQPGPIGASGMPLAVFVGEGCEQTPPTDLQVKVTTASGEFMTQVHWTIDSAPQVVEVPASIRTFLFPVALPNTGGPPADTRASWPLAAFGAALLAAGAAFVFVARRVRA